MSSYSVVVNGNDYIIHLDQLDYNISLSRTGGQGSQGPSAYDVAVQNGFEGTEQEWLDMMAMTVQTLEIYDQSASLSATQASQYANEASLSSATALGSAEFAGNAALSASTSATAASESSTESAASALAAFNSASAAAISESNSATSATSASNSELNAISQATNAANSASAASNYASSAQTAEIAAVNAATQAVASEGNAADSAASAAVSATNAGLSAAEALVSETSAGNSANEAWNSKEAAATSEFNAATSETNAATSASNAASSANAAATSATNSATSAVAASNSAANALVSATNSENSAVNSATSASNAAISASSAATSLAAVELIFDNFDDRYLGAKPSDPITDNDSDPLSAGAVYWNTTTTSLRFYNGNSWEDPEASTTASANSALTSANSAASSANSASNSAADSLTSANNSAASATSAANSASAALISETNAAHSESESLASSSDALSSKNAAAASESNAAVSASSASTSATNAAISASNASASEASAASSATSATSSANSASNSATSASASANSALTSAANAAISESDAASHAASAASSESNAATSATNALSSENAAFASEQAAAISATSASTSATNAATSATAASTSASNAATSATSAANSATNAATSATQAATSETNAANSATSAATSASNASASEISALESLTQVSNIYDQFDDRYLGSKTSAPTLDNDGNALLEGALYWNSVSKVMYVFNGTSWIQTVTIGALTADNNLSDLSNTTTALANLGLGPTDNVEFGTIKFNGSDVDNGVLSWDSTIGSLKTTLNSGLVLHHGEELYYPLVKNTTASIITKGTAVGYNGVTSGAINIQPMIADGSIDYEHYLGLASEDIGAGEYGRVNYFGIVSGINTNAYPVGTHLYVSDQTPGGFSATRLQSPSYSLRVGTVLIQDSTNGSISLVYDSIHNAEETNYDSSDTTLLATNVKAALDELSLTKVDIALLNANITFYPTTTIGDFGYYRLVTTTSDPDYDIVAVDVPTGIITTNNQLLATLISDANIIKGDPGLISIPTIGNIAKISGNNTQFAAFYFELYRRNSGGTETLVGTSNNTLNVNPADSGYHQFNASALLSNGTWAITDRLVVKYYAALTGNTGAAYYFQFGGNSPIRTEVPVPVSVIPAAPSTEILTVTANFNGILSGTDSTVQQALETIDDHDHDGIYEPADATILKDADIGVTVQAYNASTVVDAGYVHTDNNYTTTEKNKLAGIESGATADMTASEILTAIKTVDGATSGLDADLLDGQDSSYFATASGLNTEISNRTTGDANTLSSANTYTDNKVAALVDSAPATLDTLNELAAALGDDPNFATSISTTIGTKANSSVTITAGTNLTGGGDLTTNRTISHSASGVVAGTYGSSTSIPAITVDAQGHVTAASGNSISVGDGSMTVTAGSGLTGGGQVGTANQSGNTSVTLSHADTSTQANLTASSRTYVTGLTFDTYGHVTGLTTGTETVVDTNTTYNAGTGLSLSGTTFNMDVNGLTEVTSLQGTDTIPVYDVSGTAVRKVTRDNLGLQANLVSGTNIKTINGSSVLGSGDLLITGGINYVVKTANYTTQDNEGVLADTSNGSFTVTLPANPSVGDQVVVADSGDYWNVNNLTIGRNGSTIANSATDLICDLSGSSVQLVYDGTTWNVYTLLGGYGTTSQRIVTTVVATAGQTTFTTSSGYTLDYIDVYLNGIKLVNGTDYTASNGTTVVLTDAAVVNDIVEMVAYIPRGLSDGYTKAEADARYMDINEVIDTNQIANTSVTPAKMDFSAGTANGVLYLNGSKAATSGSVLTFDGAQLVVNGITVGRGAGAVSTNTAVGASALNANTTGTGLTAIGYQSLQSNTGDFNTAVGRASLNANTSGGSNAALGYNSLINNTTGSNNTGIGMQALNFNTTASNNTAVGYQAGYSNTTGTAGTFVGYKAGVFNTTASDNTAVGFQSGYTQSTGVGNTSLGAYSFQNSNGNHNTAVGRTAMYLNTGGDWNTAVGRDALYSSGASSSNTALGAKALYFNTTASNNIAIGYTALYSNTTGQINTAVGTNAMYQNTTGADNSAFGYDALKANTTGNYNTALGRQALTANTIASYNTAVGYQALYSSNRTADDNDGSTAVGFQAGVNKTTGQNNCFFGKSAGSNMTTGVGNIFIGQGCQASSTTVSSEIVIGTQATGKGSQTGFITAGGGGMYQGNNSSSWSTTSDQRLKKNIVDNTEGLDKIVAIQVRNFEYRLPEEVTELDPSCAVEKAGVQLGVIAQELQQVCSDCVKEESTGVLSVDSDNIFWHMVNAIKELKSELDSVKAELATLKGN